MVTETLFSCILLASSTYNIPSGVLYSIMLVEDGRVGEVSKNPNGSYDLGPMQINSLWLPELAKHWNKSELEAAYDLVNDPCTNINVAAWILNKKISEADGSLINGIAYYHSKTPGLGTKYALKVYETLKRNNLLKNK